jgi:hypothetical protein
MHRPSGPAPTCWGAPKPRIAARCALVTACLAAVAVSACGSSIKPATGSRGRIDDPRTAHANHVECISQHHFAVRKVGLNELLIGLAPAGPKVVFEATPGAAQGAQISGLRQQQGAEVIGSALLFPGQASDKEAAAIESCLTEGVTG